MSARVPAGVPTGGQFAASAHAESGVALAPTNLPMSDPASDAAFTGSGWGAHRPVEAVTSIRHVKADDVLAHQCEQYTARNLFLVTEIVDDGHQRRLLRGHYVDPADPGAKRLAADHEIAVWDDMLADGGYYATDIKSPAHEDGFSRQFPRMIGDGRRRGTVRTTNGGEITGLISTQGSTYPVDVETDEGRVIGISGWRVDAVRLDPETPETDPSAGA